MRIRAVHVLFLALVMGACSPAANQTATEPAPPRQPSEPDAAQPGVAGPPVESQSNLPQAPDFSLAVVGGGNFRLADAKGENAVLINLMAPW